MPYVKSISIHSTVNRSLAYILNKGKTDDLLYTASLNCMTNAKDAYLAMKMVYENFSNEKYNSPLPAIGKGSVKAIHYIQSFDPQDKVTPEQAHRIAKAFARKTFGDDCQIVIATHVDKNHIHNHFIANTYTLDGQKFNDNKTTLKNIREISDRVCLAFGIQPIPDKKEKSQNIAYNEWEHKKRGTSWKQKIRLDIDRLIGSVKNIDELLYELELLGYTVKRSKYISIKAGGQARFIRSKTLGEDYAEESLVSRIRWHDVGVGVALSGKPAPIRDDYIRALNEVKGLAREGRKIQRKRDISATYSPENDMDVYKLSAQLSIINRDHIHSIGELEGKIQALKNEYEKARRELNQLSSRQEDMDGLLESAETYFTLSDKTSLSVSEQFRMNICNQTLQNNNLNSREDFERLKALYSETGKKIAALKNDFENCKQVYDVYADIAKTYAEISKEDYVSRLAEDERKKKEMNQNRNKAL